MQRQPSLNNMGRRHQPLHQIHRLQPPHHLWRVRLLQRRSRIPQLGLQLRRRFRGRFRRDPRSPEHRLWHFPSLHRRQRVGSSLSSPLPTPTSFYSKQQTPSNTLPPAYLAQQTAPQQAPPTASNGSKTTTPPAPPPTNPASSKNSA